MTILMLCLLGAGLVLTELWGQWQACHWPHSSVNTRPAPSRHSIRMVI